MFALKRHRAERIPFAPQALNIARNFIKAQVHKSGRHEACDVLCTTPAIRR
jgi:hypothetical protein